MEERSIIMNGGGVRAILEGRKTQHRWVVKPSGKQSEWLTPELLASVQHAEIITSNDGCGAHLDHPKGGPLTFIRCPYGQPGDRLWVRETFQQNTPPSGWIYRADDIAGHIDGGWKPPIHMPRWASRITLEVVSVRVERLQEISTKDLIAEGFLSGESSPDFGSQEYTITYRTEEEMRKTLCRSNFPNMWDMNPWFWVIQFRRVR